MWTGAERIVWGGRDLTGAGGWLRDGAALDVGGDPASTAATPTKPALATAADCIAAWNAPANAQNRRRVAEIGMDRGSMEVSQGTREGSAGPVESVVCWAQFESATESALVSGDLNDNTATWYVNGPYEGEASLLEGEVFDVVEGAFATP